MRKLFLTLLFVFTAQAAIAQIAFDNATNSGDQTGNTTFSWSHTCAATNPILVVAVANIDTSGHNPAATGITYNGTALSLVVLSNNYGVNSNQVEYWYISGVCDGAAHSVSVTISGTANIFTIAGAMSFTGVDRVYPINGTSAQINTYPSVTKLPSVNVTALSSNAWVVDAIIANVDELLNNAAPSGGQTRTWNVASSGASRSFFGSYVGPITGTKTMSWTNTPVSFSDNVQIGVALAPFGTGVPPGESFTYTGANTTTSAVAYPGTIPCPASTCAGGGNLLGMNTTVTPSDFNIPITRLTDNSISSGTYFHPSGDGGAQATTMNILDNRIIVWTGGLSGYVLQWNGATKTATQLYGGSSINSTDSLVTFSPTQHYIAYEIDQNGSNNPALMSRDFTSTVTMPTPVQIMDFSTCVAAIANTSVQPTGTLLVTDDDQTFGVSFLNRYVVVWNRTNGCRYFNTVTGAITGAWGATGTANYINTGGGDTFLLHNIDTSHNGEWMNIAIASCVGSCASGSAGYMWHVPTLDVTAMTEGSTGGHITLGNNIFVTNVDDDLTFNEAQWFYHPQSNINQSPSLSPPAVALVPTLPYGLQTFNNHPSWQQDNAADKNPFCSTTYNSGVFAPPAAYINEVLCVSTNKPFLQNTIWRFAHTFSSNQEAEFAPAISIQTVSRDGKWIMWSSDWDGKLGNISGVSNACTIGVDCRSDVFIMELPQINYHCVPCDMSYLIKPMIFSESTK